MQSRLLLNGILHIRPIIAVVIVPSASADYVIAPADFHTNASKRTVMAKIWRGIAQEILRTKLARGLLECLSNPLDGFHSNGAASRFASEFANTRVSVVLAAQQ